MAATNDEVIKGRLVDYLLLFVKKSAGPVYLAAARKTFMEQPIEKLWKWKQAAQDELEKKEGRRRGGQSRRAIEKRFGNG